MHWQNGLVVRTFAILIVAFRCSSSRERHGRKTALTSLVQKEVVETDGKTCRCHGALVKALIDSPTDAGRDLAGTTTPDPMIAFS